MNHSELRTLRAFLSDHEGHDLSFEDQDYIVCLDCDETFCLPEGTDVKVINCFTVIIEVPSHNSSRIVRYTLDPMTGRVTV